MKKAHASTASCNQSPAERFPGRIFGITRLGAYLFSSLYPCQNFEKGRGVEDEKGTPEAKGAFSAWKNLTSLIGELQGLARQLGC